jgi:hypothetical protein
MEIVAKPVGRNDEEHLKSLAILFIDTPISDLHAPALELRPGRMGVAHQDGRTFLRAVASVDRKPDASAVPFHDDRRFWLRLALHFDHREVLGIPNPVLLH